MTRTADKVPRARMELLALNENPFAYPQSEIVPPEMLEQTFVVPPKYYETMLDLSKSSALTALRGGGKTASRLKLKLDIDKVVKKYFPELLIILYDDFEKVTDRLPNIGIGDHAGPFLTAVGKSVVDRILSHPDYFMDKDEMLRDWWWAFVDQYLGLGQAENIDYRVQGTALETDWRRKSNRPAPFSGYSSLTSILERVRPQLGQLGIKRNIVLVDGVDGLPETNSTENLEALVEPLVNSHFLFEFAVWKMFLPQEVERVVLQSSGHGTGRLEPVPLAWTEEMLFKLLELRLDWASDGKTKSLATLFDNELLSAEKVDVDQELVRMSQRHSRFGPPRALLWLGDRLLRGNYEEESRKPAKERRRDMGNVLSTADWRAFKNSVRNELVPHVFVSYSHKDQQFAKRLGGDLRARGTRIWLDLWKMRVGDSIIQKISDGIEDCSHFIIVLSNSSMKSRWVQEELSAGLIRSITEQNVQILPVLLEDCEIPTFLRDRYYADFRSDYDSGLNKLVASIEKLRASSASYRQEYDELQKVSASEPPTEMKDVAGRLRSLDGKVNELLDGQSELLEDLRDMRKDLLDRYSAGEQQIVETTLTALNQTQLSTVRAIVEGLDTDIMPQAEMKELLVSARESLASLAEQGRGVADLPGQQEVYEAISEPTATVKHKLKLTVPIIPLLLSYEGELGIESIAKLGKIWQQAITRVRE